MNYEQMMEARRQEILLLVQHLAALKWPRKPFIPGETPIPVTGKVFDGDDVSMLVDSALDFWLTTGRFAERFEKEFAAFMGARFCSLVNSGSSANLLALTALTDPSLKDRALKPGDEVITCACGFPTTLNPILQNRLVPVFLDVSIPTYNLDLTHLEEAVGPRTKAIMVAHTLGNPFDLDVVRDVAERKGLLVIEDCCDAVGSTWRGRQVGTFGDLATVSFYPAHHITSLDYNEYIFIANNDGAKWVKIGDFVEKYSHVGWECPAFDKNGALAWRPISGVVKHPCNEKLLKIKLQTGRIVTVSASHSLFAMQDGITTTIKASSIKPGDLILSPRVVPHRIAKRTVPFVTYVPGSWLPQETCLDLNQDLADLLGWYIAEGSLCKTPSGNHNITYTLAPDEGDIANRIVGLLMKVFGIKAKIYKNHGCHVIHCSSKALYEFLIKHSGRGSSGLRVPDFIWDAPREVQLAFLNAYANGDGHHRNQRGEHDCWECRTVSLELAHGIHSLAMLLGYSPRFTIVRKPGIKQFPRGYISKTLTAYSVAWGTSCRGIATSNGFRGDRKQKRQYGDLTQLRVVSVEEVDATTPFVYDLSIKGYENFMAGIGMIVHNTGEGGAVLTSNPYLRKIVESFRDWGRDCWCAPGHDNTCGKRFERQMGSLPFGFDHKYCVPSSCVIETKDGAITAGALAKEFISATFLFGQLQWAWAAIHPSGKKDVWSIRLANGMRLRYGFDHPVLTPSGYVRAKDLMRGDVVAVAGKLPDRPEMVIPDALLSLVGMVIADGVWAPRPHYTHFPIQWYKSDQECRDLFTQCLNDLSIPFSVNSVGYISPLKGILQKKMTDLGLLPLKAAEKRVPTALTGLSSRQSKVLLRALWSGDGCVEIGVNNNVRIVYTSRSLGLVHDIQRLLFQCGILSTITSSSVLYEGERRPYHTISVVGRDSKRVMLDLLESAPRLGGRVATLRTHLESKKERCKGIKNPSLEGDIWWVGITSVTYDGNEDVFDVSVENHEHNFVADGVVTHNTYSRIGYNLKATDMQAAVGCAQLAKLPGFIEKRKANYKFLRHALEPLQDALILPEATLWSEPSWFGFPITLKIDDRPKIIKALEAAKIATRLLFGGNLLHQPAYQDIPHRVVGTLEGADRVMRDTFWVGVYPGLAFPMLAHIANVLLGALS